MPERPAGRLNRGATMKSELQKCLDGEVFNGSDPEFAAMCLRTKRLLHEFNSTDYGDAERRHEIFSQIVGRCGRDVAVDIVFHCEYGRHILIG